VEGQRRSHGCAIVEQVPSKRALFFGHCPSNGRFCDDSADEAEQQAAVVPSHPWNHQPADRASTNFLTRR